MMFASLAGFRLTPASLIAAAACGLTAGAAHAQVVAFDNFGPGNAYSTSGWIVRGPTQASTAPDWTTGWLFESQASGGIIELVVAATYNDGNNSFRFEFREDDNGMPGAVMGSIDNVQFPSPRDVIFISADGSIELTAGQSYWIIAYGNDSAGGNWSQNDTGSSGPRVWSRDQGMTWNYSAVSNRGVFRLTVSESAGCYADCDGNEVLNIDDFLCFINEFAQAQSLPIAQQIEHYANCTGSTNIPVLTIDDFLCFINEFAQGCP